MAVPQVDVAVVGGGIVGLAAAYQLQTRMPHAQIVVLEKEAQLSAHQTGRNSGVLHSGIYYVPGSQKAKLCRAGRDAMESFAREHGVGVDRCGKVIVAVSEDELPRLSRLAKRARENGVEVEEWGADALHAHEPHVAGIRAIWVPAAGIVDYPGVCMRLVEILAERGGEVRTGVALADAAPCSIGGWALELNDSTGRSSRLDARVVLNCAGLHSDRVARVFGVRTHAQIVPFRGEYFDLESSAEHLCRGLIYPVPDPRFPFLGVHFTRMVRGGVECGPNAVWALAREGYDWKTIVPRDLVESLAYPGFQALVSRHWRSGLAEMWRSLNKGAFVRALQRLIPEVKESDLRRAPAGVRAQALRPDGQLVDDFEIEERAGAVHVINAPSPAATASLAIGNVLAARLQAQLAR